MSIVTPVLDGGGKKKSSAQVKGGGGDETVVGYISGVNVASSWR